MNDEEPQGSWDRYQVFVLRELQRLNNEVVGARTDINKVGDDVLTLKVKAGVWGGIGGAIGAGIIAVIVGLVRGH